MIADMARFMVGLTAWAAGTVIAVCVAWFGANVVIRNAGAGPGIPVVNATVFPAPTVSSPAPTPPPAVAQPTASAPHEFTGAVPAPSPTAPASASVSGVHAYALAGGNVTLNLAGDSVQLVTAVPKAGYSVQTWSGTGWLRVDFSSGPQVSSLIASWYLHAPTITVTN